MRQKQVWIKPEIRQAFEAKIVETLAKCQQHWTKEPFSVPTLVFRNIGGRAGTCLFNILRKTSVVTINPAYLQKPGGYEELLNKTLPHEVAHHVCDFIYGIGCHNKVHGWQWARVMSWIGLPPERCHHMDTTGIVKRHERPYSYSCGCNTPHFLTATMHLRIQQGLVRKICKRCRNRIEYQGLAVNGHFTPAASVTPRTPEPLKVIVPESKFRVVTRMIDGVLQNVRIPLDNL